MNTNKDMPQVKIFKHVAYLLSPNFVLVHPQIAIKRP